MSRVNDGGHAFPHAWTETNQHGASYPMVHSGMSLRDWFAGQIACGMSAFSGTAGLSYGPDDIAGRSYQIADAMLAERAKAVRS